jgi:tRNA(Ile)-lysidine synthase
MGASATPRPTPAEPHSQPGAALDRALAALSPALPVGVAFSGGADSTALLAAAARRWPGQVRALHVHHGLQAAADAFERQCAQTCLALGLPLHVAHIDARHRAGESPEDAARRARYGALAQLAREQGLHWVLLGQHADDQVETVLLALSRGAGIPGLAAMPAAFGREAISFARPFLGLTGAMLRESLHDASITWIEDPSNADTGFTRNRIRRHLLPALEASFPGFRDTFARSARHAAQAKELLETLAAEDLARMGGAPDIGALQALPRARQANLLRHWLRNSHGALPSAAQLDELLDQVDACRTRGHRIRIKVATGVVQRSGGLLAYSASV